MFEMIRRLIDEKLFVAEYSINTITTHGLFELTPLQRILFEKYEYDSDGWMYHREDSRYDGSNEIFIRLEFVNPSTGEELIFTWEANNEN